MFRQPLAIPASRCTSRSPCKAARYSACIPASQPSDHPLASASLGTSDIASLLIGRPAHALHFGSPVRAMAIGIQLSPFCLVFILRFYGVQPACRHSRCPTTGFLPALQRCPLLAQLLLVLHMCNSHLSSIRTRMVQMLCINSPLPMTQIAHFMD
ncbi:hypothetical protein GGI35DRAFT_387424 [Trichoderma velutinum]